MITGELKNKIDSLWDTFAAGGLVNPLDVIEQITYLMFIRDLDDADNIHIKEADMLGLPYTSIFADEVTVNGRKIDGSQLKWSVFRDFPASQMYSVVQELVFPFIKNLDGNKDSGYSKYMDDAIFKLPTPLLLSKVVDALDEIYALMSKSGEKDIRGDVYEYISGRLQINGRAGAFRTPRHIIDMMVEMMQPTPEDFICDPACGTAGFLVGATKYLKENCREEIFFNQQKRNHYMNTMFTGYDMGRTMLRIGAMNMMTHGVDSPTIAYRDSLSEQNPDKNQYTLVLANPPFKGSLDAEIVSPDLLKVCKTKKTELLFLALFLRMLKIGGRCACIVPDGVLFGSSTAHKSIRKELIENHRLEAVVSMPSGVFKPYAGVSTAVLVFTKTDHGGTDKVWFYDMQADGFTLDDKRTPIAENNIPDIIARFHNRTAEAERERTEQSFLVPKQEIIDNGYDLSINKYKKPIPIPVNYPPTAEIMADLFKSQSEINDKLEGLYSTINSIHNIVSGPSFQETMQTFQINVAPALTLFANKLPLYSELAEIAQKVAPIYSKLSSDYPVKYWWAIVLEIENEQEWENQGWQEKLNDFIEGEYGLEYITKYAFEHLDVETYFSDAVSCYAQGIYHACACTLAALVEHVLVKYDLPTSTKLKKRFENLLEENADAKIIAHFSLNKFCERFAFDTKKGVYAFDKKEPPFLNRHWLLHGRMKREITKFDCLQLFCAVYAILAVENKEL